MRLLSNETLIETYFKAIELKLDKDFIVLLTAELRRRKLSVSKQNKGA